MYKFKPHEEMLWKEHGIADTLKEIKTLQHYDTLHTVYSDLMSEYGFNDISRLVREVLREAQTRIDVYSRLKG